MNDEPDDNAPLEGSRDENPVNRIPNAADPVAIGIARQHAQHIADQKSDFWSRVLLEKTGRKVMWDILQDLSTFKPRFAVSPNGFPNPEATWFQAGEQSAGWRLYDALRKADFEAVQLMHTEHDPYFAEPKKSRKKS